MYKYIKYKGVLNTFRKSLSDWTLSICLSKGDFILQKCYSCLKVINGIVISWLNARIGLSCSYFAVFIDILPDITTLKTLTYENLDGPGNGGCSEEIFNESKGSLINLINDEGIKYKTLSTETKKKSYRY